MMISYGVSYEEEKAIIGSLECSVLQREYHILSLRK